MVITQCKLLLQQKFVMSCGGTLWLSCAQHEALHKTTGNAAWRNCDAFMHAVRKMSSVHHASAGRK